jgi:hypothetical protein
VLYAKNAKIGDKKSINLGNLWQIGSKQTIGGGAFYSIRSIEWHWCMDKVDEAIAQE